MKNAKVNRLSVIVYFIVAITLSGVFRFQLVDWYKDLSIPFGLTGFKYLLEGIGPLAGALLVLKLFRKKSSISLFGTSIKNSIIMIAVPVILFSIFGAKNGHGLNPHYYGFIIGVIIALYGIFEETGWRGYLQDELAELKPFWKYLIIGILWYAWHLSFISPDTTLLNELKFFGILILASWGIGQIAEKTKSVIASACFHIIGNILSFSPLLATALEDRQRYIIFAIALIIWIYIVNTWDKKAAPVSHTNL